MSAKPMARLSDAAPVARMTEADYQGRDKADQLSLAAITKSPTDSG
jgi:hypothetical protein